MRRLLALFVAATLLTVSSMPMAVKAADCELFTHTHHQAEAHMHHRQMSALFRSIARHGCIECGCGCHRNIDSLPHLLAPHAVQTALFNPGIVSVPAETGPEPLWLAAVARIPLPPPQYS